MVTWLELLSAVVYYLNFIAHSRLLWTHCIEVLYYLSALALCYSAAEYCAPVWSRSAHTSRGRCAVELYHASHLWHPPFYTSPMASSALQHWTASPMKEGYHWQADGEKCQTLQLTNPAWYPQPTIDIQEAAVAGLVTNWHRKSMEA